MKKLLSPLSLSLSLSLSLLSSTALQSPIEYQRRENKGKSNSLGRAMRVPMALTSGLRPHSSASIDRHRLPCLHSYNTSLPSLHLPSQGHVSEAGKQVHVLHTHSITTHDWSTYLKYVPDQQLNTDIMASVYAFVRRIEIDLKHTMCFSISLLSLCRSFPLF